MNESKTIGFDFGVENIVGGNRIKCLSPTFSYFPRMFSKWFIPTLYNTIPTFNDLEKEGS